MRRRSLPTKAGSDVSPAVVAQRLCDLLLSFPSAASSGVQWHTLARKYEEKHGSRLDMKTLGHDSPIVAATTLLWDVLRLVDTEDTDNPVVAVEDAVVLTPRPNALGTWPSLYKTLHNIVLSHGSSQKHADINGCEVSRGLLLSQLKPLLQIHWHTNFEEGVLGYLSDEGTWVRVRKMKHLVQAVLRWRDQRVAWQVAVGGRPTSVDEAIADRMDLVCSKRYNDLVLRCVHQDRSPPGASRDLLAPSRQERSPQIDACRRNLEVPKATPSRRPDGATADAEELAKLRWENAQLRRDNSMLLQQSEQPLATPVKPGLLTQLPVFDDPFEPPPESSRSYPLLPGLMMNSLPHIASPAVSTATPSERGMHSTPGTPHSNMSPFLAFSEPSSEHTWVDSGYATPTAQPGATSSWGGGSGANSNWSRGSVWPPVHCQQPIGLQPQQYDSSAPCTLVPVWFPASTFSNVIPPRLFGDRGVIPNGIVQQARAMFERAPPPMSMNTFTHL